MKLNPEQIRLDGGTQPRAVLSVEVMEEYADLMRSGVEFPPVIVFYDGENYWLADGFHRVGAALRAFPTRQIEADVHQGTLQEAQWFSYGVNKDHGLRRTNEDKAQAVRKALAHAHAARLSNGQIAEHCGVNEITVRRYREQLTSTMSKSPATPDGGRAPSLRTGRDGRTIRTARIGKHRRAVGAASRRGSNSPRPLKPVRGYSAPMPMTAMNVPHDPAAAARGLMALFDRPFLESLVTELTNLLEGASE